MRKTIMTWKVDLHVTLIKLSAAYIMVIRVVNFSSGEYKIRKIFA